MNLLSRLWRSSLGKKYVMAASGCVLVMFVTGHMIGNLQLFLGPEALNRYAHFLQSNVELLWPVRLVLLAMIVLHAWSAIRLSAENKAARPVEYAHGQTPFAASLASRTMLMGGLVVGAFVIYHLLHYTVKTEAINLTGHGFKGSPFEFTMHDGSKVFDVHKMVILGFSNPLVSLFYLLGVGLLCLHLSHGASAMFQSLGLRNHTWWPVIDKMAKVLAVVLCIGYLVVPAAVTLGYGHERISDLKSPKPVAAAAAVKEAK